MACRQEMRTIWQSEMELESARLMWGFSALLMLSLAGSADKLVTTIWHVCISSEHFSAVLDSLILYLFL
jgi:hypothetical protein